MPENCPRCGTRLPLVVDAFCPERRGEIRLAASDADTPANGSEPEGNGALSVFSIVSLVLAPVLALVADAIDALPARMVEVAVIAVVLASGALVVGAFFRARRNLTTAVTGHEKRSENSERPS